MAHAHPSAPPLVAAAALRASEAGFTFSCEPEVGALLAVLAAHLPAGGRVLELGTGVGVAYSNSEGSPAPRRMISGSSSEKSMTVVGSVPQSPESSTASSRLPS
jgi:hypothetical protein